MTYLANVEAVDEDGGKVGVVHDARLRNQGGNFTDRVVSTERVITHLCGVRILQPTAARPPPEKKRSGRVAGAG